MSNSICRTTKDKPTAELERIASQIGHVAPKLSQALLNLGTAMGYDDPALMRHHLGPVLENLRDLVQEKISTSLGRPAMLKEALGRTFELIRGTPAESYDELGEQIKFHIDKHLDDLAILAKAAQTAIDQGYPVDKIEQLRSEIEEIEKLKKGVFKNWPWSSRERPLLDKKMVAQSRAEIASGQGEAVEDLIRRLNAN